MARIYQFPGGMEGKVVRTQYGFEPAFRERADEDFEVEPGFAQPTRSAAIAAMEADLQSACDSAFAERHYQSQYDYACGYRD